MAIAEAAEIKQHDAVIIEGVTIMDIAGKPTLVSVSKDVVVGTSPNGDVSIHTKPANIKKCEFATCP